MKRRNWLDETQELAESGAGAGIPHRGAVVQVLLLVIQLHSRGDRGGNLRDL